MKKTFTREELLKEINDLQLMVGIESYSRVLDWKESLGFDRDEEYCDDDRMGSL